MKYYIKKLFHFFGLQKTLSKYSVYSPFKLYRGLLVNYRYNKYYNESSKNFKGYKILNRDLDEKGIVVKKNVFNLSKQEINIINEYFLDEKSCVSFKESFYKEGFVQNPEYIFLKIKNKLRTLLIKKLVESDVIDLIQNHIGSNIRLVSLNLFKTFPKSFINEGSFIWHKDNQPRNSYKLIVYLSKVDSEKLGAFRYNEGTHKKGKIIPHFGNSRDRKTPVTEGKTVFGDIGDGFIFDINGFHLGGRCSDGERTVAVFHFKPSILSFLDHLNKYNFAGIGEMEFGINPHKIWWNK